MNSTRCKIVLLLLITAGCAPYPRFRTDGPERPRTAYQTDSTRTTNDNLRLGMIVQSYLGKPYTGRSKWERGVDCSFFIRDVFRKYDGRELPRTVALQYKQGRALPRNHIRYGDLVFFKTDHKPVSHVGIYLGQDQFAHASTSSGVIVSRLTEEYWARRYVGARRIIEP
jgi:lipoprotein Spr